MKAQDPFSITCSDGGTLRGAKCMSVFGRGPTSSHTCLNMGSLVAKSLKYIDWRFKKRAKQHERVLSEPERATTTSGECVIASAFLQRNAKTASSPADAPHRARTLYCVADRRLFVVGLVALLLADKLGQREVLG